MGKRGEIGAKNLEKARKEKKTGVKKFPGPPEKRPLRPREEKFCQQYIIDFNGSRSAREAGYTPNNPAVTASTLLKRPNIISRIEQLKRESVKRVEIKADDVLSELLLILKSNVDNYVYDSNGKLTLSPDAKPEAIRAVSGVKRRIKRYIERGRSKEDDKEVEVEEVEYRLWDKTKALDLGMRHLGLTVDRLKIEDPDEVLSRLLGVDKDDLP